MCKSEMLEKLISHYTDGNKAQFAVMLGVKPQTISAWISRGTFDAELIYAKCVGVSADWLMTGNGNMIADLQNADCYNSPLQNVDEDQPGELRGYRLVPIVHIDSVGGMHSSNDIIDESLYNDGCVPFVDAQDEDIAIFQSGDSMSPTIPPGSLLLIREVKNWKEYLGYGNVFVVVLKDGRRLTKEITRYDEDPKNYVWCVSYNPNVPKEELPKSMILSVWKVVKVLTNKGW